MTSHTEPLNIEQLLFDAAANFVKQRYPQGWGGAGAVYTEAGSLLISIAPEVITMPRIYVWKQGLIWKPTN
ncbi:hypothetical protein PAXY110619_04700 [Paenibacillus xylanexedens]|uniref:Uncharacterized protein n=1 Tax=Paenibacillus xylanexedens TaxID=528191 RepID=A0ABS4RQ06_PAEXY|nr:hypothetical protein [Paenibacillus xylanexedens]